MKSFNDGPAHGCWALWLQSWLLGRAFLFVLHRFPNTEGETREQGIGISLQNKNSTYPLHYQDHVAWEAIETIPTFPEVSPARSKCRFIKMVSYSMVKFRAPHSWLRLCAFHSVLWQPNWWMTQFTMMEMGGIFLWKPCVSLRLSVWCNHCVQAG